MFYGQKEFLQMFVMCPIESWMVVLEAIIILNPKVNFKLDIASSCLYCNNLLSLR